MTALARPMGRRMGRRMGRPTARPTTRPPRPAPLAAAPCDDGLDVVRGALVAVPAGLAAWAGIAWLVRQILP